MVSNAWAPRAALVQIPHLSARLMEVDERTAKGAIYGLNRAGGRTPELEEAWIIQALVREDGLSQVEVAELSRHHLACGIVQECLESWVQPHGLCRDAHSGKEMD